VRRVPAPAPRQNVLPKTRGNILTGCDFGRPQRKIAFGFLALFLLLWGGLRFHHQETESKRRSRQKMFELESMVKELAELAKTKISPEPQRCLGNAGPGSWPFVEEHMLRLQDVLERAVGGDKGYIIGNIAFHPLQVRCRMGEGWCGVRRREMLNPDLCGFTHPPTWRSLDAPHPTA
jgi:hypothetical protein